MNAADEQAQHQPIGEDDCRRLVATQDVGRLVIGSTLPNVRPLNYAASGNRLFVRTDDPLPNGVDVAFEVDQIDSTQKQGWSVVARGVLHQVETC